MRITPSISGRLQRTLVANHEQQAMKKQVLYIHGGEAFKNREDFLNYLRTVPLRDVLPGQERPKRWADTLATDLGRDYEVYAPSMPNSKNADYEAWKIWFERYLALVADGVVLVGWSQGAWFLAKYLAENEPMVRVAALFLLAGPSALMDEVGGDNPEWAFDIAALRSRLEKGGVDTYIFHSKDDPVVPFSHALAYAQALPGATGVFFLDKGHFLVPELPELIAVMRRCGKENESGVR